MSPTRDVARPAIPVVFVHGLIGPFVDGRALAALGPRRVTAPDLLGYGAALDADERQITIAAQTACLRRAIDRLDRDGPVHLAGHSVGVVVAAAFADESPDRVALVNVEGNFTLADAFWSAQIADQRLEEVEALLDGFRADPAGWLVDAGASADPRTVRTAAARRSRAPGGMSRCGRSSAPRATPGSPMWGTWSCPTRRNGLVPRWPASWDELDRPLLTADARRAHAERVRRDEVRP
jgi:pimeloyl-ACP methyl ester carboxylesterase